MRIHGWDRYAHALGALETPAIYDGSEDYFTIKKAMQPLIEVMEDVHKDGGVVVKFKDENKKEATGKVVIEWLGGGDMA